MSKNSRISPLTVIFLIVFVNFLGFGIILPLLPFYAESFGATPLQIGVLTASFSFMQLIATPILGLLSDRYGRRLVLLLSIAGTVFSFLILGLARSLQVLFLARIIDGLTGGNISTAQAVIADTTSAQSRAKGMGVIGAAFGSGFIMGPAIGGYFSQFGYSLPAYIAAAVAALAWVVTFFFLPETMEVNATTKDRLSFFSFAQLAKVVQQNHIYVFLLLTFLLAISFSMLTSTLALFTEHKFKFGALENGYLFAYVGVLIVIVQGGLIGRLVDRFGEGSLVKAGLLLSSMGLLGEALSASVVMLVIASGLIAFGNGIFAPSLNALISQRSDAKQQGEIMGINFAVISLANIFGPVIGGWTFAKFGYSSPALLATGGVMLAFLVSSA